LEEVAEVNGILPPGFALISYSRGQKLWYKRAVLRIDTHAPAPRGGFHSMPNMPSLLTEADYAAAAKKLNCDIAAIKAVAEVESSGNGFLSDGRVKILFEGHQFYKYTKGAFAVSHPTLCYKKWTKKFYTTGPNADVRGAGELARLADAIALNRTAALMSASYGKFQIMGFNFAVSGFPTVDEFYESMQISEGEQLNAFCNYIKGNSIDDELRSHNWAGFAFRYNGAEYKKNQYDTKLAKAHKKYGG